MDIYKVKYYGTVYYIMANNEQISLCLVLNKGKSSRRRPRYEFNVSCKLLKNYKGRNDVIRTRFGFGEYYYETLNKPYYYYENDTWIPSNQCFASEEFKKLLRLEKESQLYDI